MPLPLRLLVVAMAVALACPESRLGAQQPRANSARDIDLAEADSLAAVVDRFTNEWYFTDAFSAAARQLDLRVRHLGPLHADVLAVHHTIGKILGVTARFRAEEQLRYTLELRQKVLGPDHRDVASTWIALGRIVQRWQAIDSDLECFAEAERILQRSGASESLVLADLRNGQANAARRRGRLEDAETLYGEALRIRRELLGEQHPDVASTLVWMAHVVGSRGRVAEAEAMIRKALRTLRETRHSSHPMSVTANHWLALRAAADDRFHEADSLYNLCRVWQRQQRSASPMDFGLLRSDFGSDHLAALQLRAGEPEAAWVTLEEGRGWTSGTFAAQPGIRMGHPTARRLKELGNEILSLERELAARWSSRDSSAHEIRRHLFNAEAERLRLERDLLRDADRQAAPESGLHVARSAIDAKTAIVGWTEMRFVRSALDSTGRFARWAHVMRHTGPVRWIHLGTWTSRDRFRALGRVANEYRRAIRKAAAWPQRVAPDPRLDALGVELWRQLVEPLLPALNGVEHLVVVSPAYLRAPPLEVLRDATGRYVVDRFSVSYTTSAALLASLKAARPAAITVSDSASRLRSALVVGDPCFAPGDMCGFEVVDPHDSLAKPHASILDAAVVRGASAGDPDVLDQLPPLPFSAYEANVVASCFNRARVLAGQNAVEARLESLRRDDELSSFNVIHVATHSLVASNPERCAFVMGRPEGPRRPENAHAVPHDRLVTSREILVGWRLNAELVVLSGCQTGGRHGRLDGPYGFRQALLKAGARSIIDSQWEVDDVATALLMERFYENYVGRSPDGQVVGRDDARMPKAKALAEAKRWLRRYEDGVGRRPFAHPVYWGGFVLFGDPE